jgi:hypothetical protein
MHASDVEERGKKEPWNEHDVEARQASNGVMSPMPVPRTRAVITECPMKKPLNTKKTMTLSWPRPVQK